MCSTNTVMYKHVASANKSPTKLSNLSNIKREKKANVTIIVPMKNFLHPHKIPQNSVRKRINNILNLLRHGNSTLLSVVSLAASPQRHRAKVNLKTLCSSPRKHLFGQRCLPIQALHALVNSSKIYVHTIGLSTVTASQAA